MLKKIAGLQGSTLSDHRMTTGFGPFELPTCGLLQRGRDHSPPKACLFEEPSFLSKYYEYAVAKQNYEYTVAKQNGGGAEWVELFITLTKGMATNVRTLAVSHHVLEFEACSARPASKVLRWTLARYSGLVVWRLSRGIIYCESSRSAGFKWDVLLLVTGYLT